MSTMFPTADVPAPPARTWLGRTANGLGLTCLLLAILAIIFQNSSYTLCGYSVLMVLLTAPVTLFTVLLGFVAREKFAWRTGGIALLVVLATFLSYGLPPCGERIVSNDVSAVGSLRTLNTALVRYATAHPEKGYPASYEELTRGQADWIDEVLARGDKSGFRFEYIAGPPDAQGRIATYALHARPIQHGSSGFRNFFADQSGTIWQTQEDRRATATDHPVN